MITDLCLARVLSEEDQESCGSKCLNDHYKLQDEFAQNYKIFTDEKCRNYIFYPYDLCLLPYLNELLQNGINHFRLECQYYPAEKLIEVFKIYRQALRDAQNPTGGQADNFNRLLRLSPEGLAAVPWIHKSKAGI
nr:U32 family peptidase [Syntrophomonas palmitatica]